METINWLIIIIVYVPRSLNLGSEISKNRRNTSYKKIWISYDTKWEKV